MASNSGKWVQRAATTGGGRTYRGQMPVNWYASLVVICVVGLLLIGFSRYQRTHPTTNSSGPPTTSQTWYAALGVDVCGTIEPNLPATTATSKNGFISNGNGVLTIAPKNSSQSGSNATLGRFVSEYPGMQLTNSVLQYPGKPAMTNGNVCPKGTPDAGKPGVVIVNSWPNFTSKTGSETSGDPQNLLFTTGPLTPLAFVPPTPTTPNPPAKAITSLISATAGGSTAVTVPPTATTAPPTPTTAPK